jgi:hypothetical protein
MKGISYTYFTTDNAKSARELVTILREAKAVVPPQLEEMSMYGGGGGGRGAIINSLFVCLANRSFLSQAGMEAVEVGVEAAVATEVEGVTGAVVVVVVAGKQVKNSCPEL